MGRGLGAVTLVLAVALTAVGCGGKTSYSLAKTRECLTAKDGVRIGRRVDFVASNALGGAMTVRVGPNRVVISFGQDEQEAQRIAAAYRRVRGRNIGIEDILRPQRNAVLLWRAHPDPNDEETVTGCLK